MTSLDEPKHKSRRRLSRGELFCWCAIAITLISGVVALMLPTPGI